MPTYQLLTDRTLAQSSAITPTTLIHIVTTGDTSQNSAGSSFKAELGQLVGLFSGGSISGDYLPLSGGSVTGNTIFTSGLTANTINVGGVDLNITELQNRAIVVTGGTISAENDKVYHSIGVGTTTYNDPTGVEGRGFWVFVRIGTSVIGGSSISINGLLSFRVFSGGSWATYNFLNAGTISTIYTPLTRTINGKSLTTNIILGPTDVSALPISGGTVTGTTNFTNGLSANTISATTIGNSGDCVDDIYVSNIHSCSPLNINPLDEGNVYFGSTSGVTIDLTNTRIGIGTSTPQFPFQIAEATNTFYYDPTSAGGRFNISGNTNIPRYDVTIGPYLTRPASGGSVGIRTWDDVTFPGYGKVGDMHMYAGNEIYGLNIINGPGTNTEDYIRFYAGQTATGTADIHIQGTGTTRGFVGLGTESPIEKLHVVGNAFVSGNVSASTLSANTLILSGVTVNPKQLIALFFGHDSLSPGDTQTYYIGNSINLTAPISGSDGRRVTIPKTGNIIRVGIVQTVGGTLGSSETSTITVNNVTQATQSTITTTFTYDSSSANISYDLSSPLAVNQGDKIELRWTTPAWVTNPTAVRQQMNVYLEY